MTCPHTTQRWSVGVEVVPVDNCPWCRIRDLEAALRDLLDDMGEDVRQRHHRDKYRVYQISPQTVEAARKTLLFPTAPETPPHLRGRIIQAYADSNGVPPQAETKVCTCDRVTQPDQHFPGCPSFASDRGGGK